MYLDWKSRMFFLTKEDLTPIITAMAPFYVGRNAEEKLKSGWRLVCSELQPEACDMVWYKPKKNESRPITVKRVN